MLYAFLYLDVGDCLGYGHGRLSIFPGGTIGSMVHTYP
jgi:hypothetical protein